MAVNTAALKTFAPAMRRQLMEAVGRKLDLLLNSQTPDTLSTYAKQIAELRDEQEKSREQLLERAAYTWFNRLCALRYLDAKGWHPFGCKVLMPGDGNEIQPELLKLMRSGSLPADLKTFTNEQRLNQLLDGQIPTAIPGGDAQGEVYRELLLAACRSYHQLLPDLFEGLDDASELLLPDDLLTEGSIAGSFRSSISDADCDDVEIIGWFYQFYISEKKDEVIGKVVKSEDIPAATQLFTPNWIVKYMVQNTIGAQWLATYPDSPLREQMEFYIEPAEQTDEVHAKLAEITPKSLNPEELTLMDPACGSGHILVEAYEIFKAIYLEQGYQLREIPKLIFEKNLYGLDIDQRAAQLTIFALLMKGRADDRRLFDRGVKLNVMAMQNSSDFDAKVLAQHINLSEHGLELVDLTELKLLFVAATTFGSLIQVPEGLLSKLSSLKNLSSLCCEELIVLEETNRLRKLVQQAQLLAKQYDAVVANPPYMGSKSMNIKAREFTKTFFPKSKSDLFACFIERSLSLAADNGRCSMITMPSWLFLSSFIKLRKSLLKSSTISSLLHMGRGIFGIDFGSVAFAIQKSTNTEFLARYFRLHKRAFQHIHIQDISQLLKNAARDTTFKYNFDSYREMEAGHRVPDESMQEGEQIHFYALQARFEKIIGSPIAYWMSKNAIKMFDACETLGNWAHPMHGMSSGNNATFLRIWHEVPHSKFVKPSVNFEHCSTSSCPAGKWFPLIKGGPPRKWYGNNDWSINFESNGQDMREAEKAGRNPGLRLDNAANFFNPCISWSSVTSGGFSMRSYPAGFVFGNGGHCVVLADEMKRGALLGAMNSSIMNDLVKSLSPTLNFEVGTVEAFPIALEVMKTPEQFIESVIELVSAARLDWDAYERSWDFQSLALLNTLSKPNSTLESSYFTWIADNKSTIANMRHLEVENNRLFIDEYGLADELTPDVPIEQITLTINPAYRYSGEGSEEEKWERFQRDSMAELLSYATGCMMGRYSLDHPGLILADSRSNQEEQIAVYEAKVGKSINKIQFKPDADAIIPVLDGEWFEDDIVARTREFLKVTFPESSVAENLRFIEDSIGKDIRKYFCKDFYKDHLQTYKKRPIYWMVQSPKAGFACLIYLHRYTPDTLLQVLNNYFRPYLQKLEARQEQLERDQNNDALPKREQTAARKEAEKITKVLKECQAWEQDALLPLAQQRIELDLDDGVKVNYLKLQEVLAKIPGLAAKGD